MQDAERPNMDDWLWQAAEVQELLFTSRVPVAGGLIATVRRLWSEIADRPYVRPLRREQSKVNRLVLQEMTEIDCWLLTQDREQVSRRRETAMLANWIRQLDRRIRVVENSVTEPEQR